jgi:ATP-dependent Clp protease ATP-binding subunit ClpA
LLHDDTATGVALGEVGVSLAGARERIGQSQGAEKEPHGHVPFTPRAKRVLEQSLRHAQRLGQAHIARPHLLLALLDVRDSVAVQTLVAFGVDLDTLAGHVDELASASEPETRPGPGADVPATASAPWPQRTRRLQYLRRSEPGRDLAAALDGLARRDALAHALRRYAHHDESCDQQQGCTCGLQPLLDELDSPD